MAEFLEILVWGAAALGGSALAIALLRWARVRLPRVGRALRRDRRPPEWRIALIVRVDESGRRVYPGVELRGDPVPRSATLALELFDGEDRRALISRPLPAASQNQFFAFSDLVVPEGATLREVLRWRWEVSLKARRREVIRWRESLTALGGLNAEGEIGTKLI